MNEQAIRFRIGIFVLAALILLAVLVILFGGLPISFHPSTSYTIRFDNAQGVATGTPVRRSGVKIGEVRGVTLDNDTGKVEVTIQINNGFTLRQGDKPTLKQSILGGDAAISFVPPAGKEVDTSPVEPGAVLQGVTQPDTGTLVQKTTEVLPPVEEALKEVKKTFERIDKLVEKISPEMEETLRSARLTSDEIRGFVKSAQKSIPEKDIKKLFENIDKMAPELQDALRSLRLTSDEIRGFVKSTQQAIPEKDIKKFFEKVDKLVPVVEGAFAKIDQFVPVVEKSLAKVDKLVPEFGKTNDEFQLLARNWTKVGERVDVLIRTNEDKIVKTIERAEDALKRVNEIFNDDNQKNVRDTLRNVRVSSDRFDGIARNTDELLKDSRSTMKTFNDAVVKVDRVLGDLEKVSKPLAARSDSILRNLDEGSDKLNRTLGDVREILQVLARNDGTIQKLLTDPSLYNNLNEATLSLSRIMPRLDHILGDVAIFADKLARHPELIGLGGVVRPSLGLKNSPSPYKVFPVSP